jgi:hypothetical protein
MMLFITQHKVAKPMLKKLDFNFVLLGYLLFLAVILIAFTGTAPNTPRQLLILKFSGYQEMKSQTEQLFKKGWQVKDMEPYHHNSQSTSDFIVIYER